MAKIFIPITLSLVILVNIAAYLFNINFSIFIVIIAVIALIAYLYFVSLVISNIEREVQEND